MLVLVGKVGSLSFMGGDEIATIQRCVRGYECRIISRQRPIKVSMGKGPASGFFVVRSIGTDRDIALGMNGPLAHFFVLEQVFR